MIGGLIRVIQELSVDQHLEWATGYREVGFRPARALLSHRSLEKNLQTLRKILGRKSSLHRAQSEIMAVVKADAYGHHIDQVLPVLIQRGIRHVCVASLEEGMAARAVDSEVEILVLGGNFNWNEASLRALKENKLELAINDLETLEILSDEKQIPLHLKLDTGMNRLGIKERDWGAALDLMKRRKISLKGLMSHYASARGSNFRRQVKAFDDVARWYWEEGLRPHWIHSENSAALFSKEKIKTRFLGERANMARPGLALYGYLPNPYGSWTRGLEPILSLVSEIGQVKEINKGEGVSYEHLYRASRSEKVYIVPIGYADGVSKAYAKDLKPRLLKKSEVKSSAKLKASELSICGAICMDMIILKASRNRSKSSEPKAGDSLLLWGPSLQELVKKKVADPYELNLRLAPRIPRIWVD